MLQLMFADLSTDKLDKYPYIAPSKVKDIIVREYKGRSKDLKLFPVVRSNAVARRIEALLVNHAPEFYIRRKAQVRLKAGAPARLGQITSTHYEEV